MLNRIYRRIIFMPCESEGIIRSHIPKIWPPREIILSKGSVSSDHFGSSQPCRFKKKKAIQSRPSPHFVNLRGQNSNQFLEDLRKINSLRGFEKYQLY